MIRDTKMSERRKLYLVEESFFMDLAPHLSLISRIIKWKSVYDFHLEHPLKWRVQGANQCFRMLKIFSNHFVMYLSTSGVPLKFSRFRLDVIFERKPAAQRLKSNNMRQLWCGLIWFFFYKEVMCSTKIR